MNQYTWNEILSHFEFPSLLQSWEWSEIKSKYGWERDFRVWEGAHGNVEAATLILIREHRFNLFGIKARIAYLPHGPLLDWQNLELRRKVLKDLKDYACEINAAYIKIDPQIILAKGKKGEDNYHQFHTSEEVLMDFKDQQWIKSNQEIQFKNTFWLDLTDSEEEILSNMKQKTRYNVRLAERKGVKVRILDRDEISILFKMYLETSDRDGFIIRPEAYYMDLWNTFMESGMATPLVAEVEGVPVAGLFLFHFHNKSYYLYGMSLDSHREKMPNYLLQWEAIRHSKRLGCLIYDLWGAPDVFDSSHKMWGVYRFKQGLGAEVIRTIGAYDYPTSKIKYKIIQMVLPGIQKVTRMIRKNQIRKQLGY